MNEFKKLRKMDRLRVAQEGAVKRVALKTGKTKATVSRTLAGLTKTPNLRVVEALREEVDAILHRGGFQAKRGGELVEPQAEDLGNVPAEMRS